MKVRYNSPVTLSFTFICALILILDTTILPNLTENFFAAPGRGGFSFGYILGYFRLFTHIIGHENWTHLMGNFAFILLLGPMLEEKYGSKDILLMMLITALITGLLNVLFFSTGLYGASGIVFMLILLSSFTNFKKGEIPLTFILIIVLYLGQEVASMLASDNISQAAHIIGGGCGSLFGFILHTDHDKKNKEIVE